MPKENAHAGKSLFAGVVAGGIEGFLTYPAEYAKTVSQFQSKGNAKPAGPLTIITETVKAKGLRGIYSGCGALVAGNAAKAGVRFLTYDQIKSYLADENGRLTPERSLLAGLGAGVCEAILAVTPSETIKTKLIDDAKRAVPRYHGLVNGTVVICQTEGIAGVYRGLFPTIMKQGANSAVRFTSYSTIKQWLQDRSGTTKALSPIETFGAGAAAGVITVCPSAKASSERRLLGFGGLTFTLAPNTADATMPLDNIKTRMQSLNAATEYRNSFHCALRVAREEGALSFWRGATPRLTRLSMSGGIVFFVYEKVMAAIQ
ncbi:hypothetical protein BMF94_4480 [Rhodotorula taiwanensis]|uniref:Uncharacterized protein n=1 Tax=Rhodotorula taiwanensis TaxID=741276 RepID=A0A2S5B798_9BASI|nr:hypothetical protein BMF94_4480 [Rhodotorula taiwanensis]